MKCQAFSYEFISVVIITLILHAKEIAFHCAYFSPNCLPESNKIKSNMILNVNMHGYYV